MKRCGKCTIFKPIDAFSNDVNRKDGKGCYCKSCDKDYRIANRGRILENKKRYLQDNKASINAKQRAFYHTNKPHCKSLHINNMNNPTHWAKRLLSKSKERAIASGMDHTITLIDICIPKQCPYLKIDLTFLLGSGQLLTNASIDRIDNSLGYIPGNIQIISRLANTMKNCATQDQLLEFARNVIQLSEQKL